MCYVPQWQAANSQAATAGVPTRITQLQHNQRISGQKFDKQPSQEPASQRNKWHPLHSERDNGCWGRCCHPLSAE